MDASSTREIREPVHTQLPLPYDVIAEMSRRFDVAELAVFGSVLRPDFTPESDVDFLVTFVDDDEGPWMSKLQQLESELAIALGREVDVVSRRGIEQSRNERRRRAILDSAVTIYER